MGRAAHRKLALASLRWAPLGHFMLPLLLPLALSEQHALLLTLSSHLTSHSGEPRAPPSRSSSRAEAGRWAGTAAGRSGRSAGCERACAAHGAGGVCHRIKLSLVGGLSKGRDQAAWQQVRKCLAHGSSACHRGSSIKHMQDAHAHAAQSLRYCPVLQAYWQLLLDGYRKLQVGEEGSNEHCTPADGAYTHGVRQKN